METTAKQAVDTMTQFVNPMSNSEAINKFIELMSRDHRTLQQSFTKLCVHWLHHLSKLEEGDYDLRNEASVKLAKKLMSSVRDNYDLVLPTI